MSVSYYDDEAPISLAEKIMIGSVVLMFVFAFFNSVRACGGPCPTPPVVSPPPIIVPPPLPPPVTVPPGKNPPSAPVGGGGVSVSGGGTPVCMVQGTCKCMGLSGKFLWSCLQNPPTPNCGFHTGKSKEMCEKAFVSPVYPQPSPIQLPIIKPFVVQYKG